MKDNKALKVGSVFAGLFIIIGLIVLVIDIFCFDRSFYSEEYTKNGTTYVTGMSKSDLMDTTEVLLDYLRDERDDLSVRHEVNGELREVFNEREKAHMVDVKALYLGARTFCYILLAAGILFATFCLLSKKRRRTFLKGYLWSNAVFFVIYGALAVYAAIDFSSFWIHFHHIFFTNDLWLMDYNTDILVMMVPGQFFFDLVMRIAITSVAVMAALLVGAAVWSKRIGRKQA